MKDTTEYIDNSKKQEILWSSKPTQVKDNLRKWYHLTDPRAGLFEKIIVNVSIIGGMVSGIYNLFVNGITTSFILGSAIFLILVCGLLILKSYLDKRKFENSKYILTKDDIIITSWSIIGGTKLTKIDLKNITKTYLLGISEKIGTVLLYSNEDYERPRDLMRWSKLPTIALQYIDNPKAVLKLIDQHR